MLNNNKLLFALFFLGYVFIPPYVSADDTCCLGHGGDYSCNYSTQQLYCQDGSVSNQCTCQAGPTATPTPLPTQVPAASPECPANAGISESSNACTCNSGYVISNNSCVTYAQYCQSQYGNTAVYDSGSNACVCSSGDTWNTNGSACITMDGLCNEKIGSKSYYNSSNNSCYCYDGYSIRNGQCQIIPTPVPPDTVAPTTGVPIGPIKSVPVPTIAGAVVPTHAPTPTKAPVKRSVVKFDPHKKVPGLNEYVAMRKKPVGFFETILDSIVTAIKRAFNI